MGLLCQRTHHAQKILALCDQFFQIWRYINIINFFFFEGIAKTKADIAQIKKFLVETSQFKNKINKHKNFVWNYIHLYKYKSPK